MSELAEQVRARESDPSVKQAEMLWRAAREANDAATRALADAESRLKGLNEKALRAKQALVDAPEPPALPDSCHRKVLSCYESQFSADDAGTARLRGMFLIDRSDRRDRITQAAQTAVEKSIAALKDETEQKKAAVETAMTDYLRRWPASDEDVAADVLDIAFYGKQREALAGAVLDDESEAKSRKGDVHELQDLLTMLRGSIREDENVMKAQIAAINSMLERNPYGSKGATLWIHHHVRELSEAYRKRVGRIGDMMQSWKAEGLPEDLAALKGIFSAYGDLVAWLEEDLEAIKDGRKRYKHDLDLRRRTRFSAKARAGEEVAVLQTTANDSGGQMSELISFLYGAAILYLLGDEEGQLQGYSTLFLDEALIKADGNYTQRALSVLVDLGFQIVVLAPTGKVNDIMPAADIVYLAVKSPMTGTSQLQLVEREGV